MSGQSSPRSAERPLTGRTALVTGGSGDLGRGIAVALARDGADIAIVYHSHRDAANELVDDLGRWDVRVAAYQADLGEIGGIAQLFDSVVRDLGPPDIVVANAGMPSNQPFDSVDAEAFDNVFAINARSVFFLLQEAARRMPDGGRLINVSSSQSRHPARGFALYAGSKAASERFVASLAIEVASRRITANTVVVGPIDGGFLDQAPDTEKRRLAENTMLGRLGAPGEIGALVAFLASEGAGLITGQSIVADGGVLRL